MIEKGVHQQEQCGRERDADSQYQEVIDELKEACPREQHNQIGDAQANSEEIKSRLAICGKRWRILSKEARPEVSEWIERRRRGEGKGWNVVSRMRSGGPCKLGKQRGWRGEDEGGKAKRHEAQGEEKERESKEQPAWPMVASPITHASYRGFGGFPFGHEYKSLLSVLIGLK